MWRLCRTLTSVLLAAVVTAGCGSTGSDDDLVLRFVGFNGVGLEQQDSVRETSADVDAVQTFCGNEEDTLTVEPFTQTVINAVFRNEQMLDVFLDGYTVHFDDPRTGLADITNSLSGRIVGGRCSNTGVPCALNNECATGGDGGGDTAVCEHTNSVISGLVLVDFSAKAHVNPDIFGQATSLTITFHSHDAISAYQTVARYVVTFGNYNNCAGDSAGS